MMLKTNMHMAHISQEKVHTLSALSRKKYVTDSNRYQYSVMEYIQPPKPSSHIKLVTFCLS